MQGGHHDHAPEQGADPAAGDPAAAPHGVHDDASGTLTRRFFEYMFGPMQFPAGYSQRVQGLAERGLIVYIARGRSLWLALYLNHILSRLGLPLARFVGGVNLWLWHPLRRLWQRQRWFARRARALPPDFGTAFGARAPSHDEAALAEHALRGEPTLLIWRPPRSSHKVPDDFLRVLITVQRLRELPVFLLPHVVADRIQSGAADPSLTDRIFGDRRRPGGLRTLAMLLTTLRRAVVRMAEPIDLQQWVQEHPESDPDKPDPGKLARRLRHELNRRMDAEERVVAGGRLHDAATITRHVLRNPLVRDAIDEQLQQDTGVDAVTTLESARHHLRGIAARYNVRYIQAASRILASVFSRIYDGIAIDEVGLAQVIEASRHGPVIFCPSHRSHVDYLLLSFLLWQHGVTPPHIAAGANLSFFPLGPFFRRSGAFFLRRSFRDDDLYRAVMRAYVMELLRDGVSIEFFLEGTRSRTGKHLMPRFGFLSMLTDAWRRGAAEELIFVPISIDYERIIDAGAYQQELRGGEKKKEDLGGLLRTTRVLRSRYGRLHVQFGEPISMAATAAQRGLVRDADRAHDEAWRRENERLGFRILREVAMVCSATPTSVVATALLSHHRRGIARAALIDACAAIIDFVQTEGARLSQALQEPDSRKAALLIATQRLVDDRIVAVDRAGASDAEPIYRVPADKRGLLDFHKNALMNYFAPACLVARAIMRATTSERVPYQDVRQGTLLLSKIFKREFLFRSDANFDTYFDETLAGLAARGLLDVEADDNAVVVRSRPLVEMLAAMLDGFVEGYWLTARTLPTLREFPLWRKELLTRCLEKTRRAFLEGEIRRPEAANRTLIATALEWFEHAGVIESRREGKKETLRLSAGCSEARLEELISEIGSFK